MNISTTVKDSIEIALQERIKELNCLYEMARLAERHDSLEGFLKCLVDFLPQSWRYAEVACSRIVFQGHVFESKGFEQTEWGQSAQIRVDSEVVGQVTVIYREERPVADEGPFLKEERTLLEGIALRIGEIAIRIMAQQERMLERKSLQEVNAALRIVLSNIEEEKKRIYDTMQLNIDKVIMPILHSLMPVIGKEKQKYLDILKSSLEEITSPYTSQVINRFHSLTSTEVNICNMIRNGLTTKDIAALRGISTDTVSRHRERIRRKLKITNQKVNLTAYLQSLKT